jgi:hypothetical protein
LIKAAAVFFYSFVSPKNSCAEFFPGPIAHGDRGGIRHGADTDFGGVLCWIAFPPPGFARDFPPNGAGQVLPDRGISRRFAGLELEVGPKGGILGLKYLWL